jgi:iron complex transport system substrate-binding protein
MIQSALCLSVKRRLSLLVCSTALMTTPFALADAYTVDTLYGAINIPDEPVRVVVLDDAALDTALSVGVKPVGTLATRGGTQVPDYLQEKAGAIEIVGSVREPNLEAIFAAQPDMIIANSGTDRALYDKLSQIAPTLVSTYKNGEPWEKGIQFYAQALNKNEAVQTQIDEIHNRLTSLKAKVPAAQTVSVVRWNPQGPIVMSDQLFVGQLLESLGMKSPSIAQGMGGRPHSDTLSLENLSQVDGDWLFLATLNSDGQAALEAARSQPAFERLEAVKQGHVEAVDGQIWSSGYGVLAADQVLDTLEATLANE